ncbi:MAG: YibE/F family protein [Maledivibacter sp.]|nr:YibE/F family protein [Maledivibacter sp.]
MKRYYKLIIFMIMCVIIIYFSPMLKMSITQPNYFEQDFEEAEVLKIMDEELEEDPVLAGRYMGTQRIKVKILSGKYEDKIFEIVNPLSSSHNVLAKEGMILITCVREKNGEVIPWVYNYKRDKTLYILLAAFFLLIIIFGGIKGINSIISLIFTGIMIVFVMLPLIFQGKNPIWVAILTTSITTIVTFILIGGLSYKSLAAILGTIAGVTIAGLISYTAGEVVHLSGITMEKGQQLLYVAKDYRIQIRGLMFTAILIASLGAIMDVAMSISSATFELYKTDPKRSKGELFKSAMNIGKDIMGTMSNTLILAFVGSSLNTIMLIWGFQMKHKQFMNIPSIGTEVIQGLAGSIGIILTVPITAAMAVALLKKEKMVSKNISR